MRTRTRAGAFGAQRGRATWPGRRPSAALLRRAALGALASVLLGLWLQVLVIAPTLGGLQPGEPGGVILPAALGVVAALVAAAIPSGVLASVLRRDDLDVGRASRWGAVPGVALALVTATASLSGRQTSLSATLLVAAAGVAGGTVTSFVAARRAQPFEHDPPGPAEGWSSMFHEGNR